MRNGSSRSNPNIDPQMRKKYNLPERNYYGSGYMHLDDEPPVNVTCIKFKAGLIGFLIGTGLGIGGGWAIFTKPWQHSNDLTPTQPPTNTSQPIVNTTALSIATSYTQPYTPALTPTVHNLVQPLVLPATTEQEKKTAPVSNALVVRKELLEKFKARKKEVSNKAQPHYENTQSRLNLFAEQNRNAKLEKLRGNNVQNNFQKRLNHR